MGFMMLYAPCLVCKRPFGSNASYVPSLNNEPVCRACMEWGNAERVAQGLTPHPIHPLAYEPEEVV